MTPEQWQQVTDALDRILHASATQRLEYLAEIAHRDPELHRELESLLVSHEHAGTEFLNAPTLQTTQDAGKQTCDRAYIPALKSGVLRSRG